MLRLINIGLRWLPPESTLAGGPGMKSADVEMNLRPWNQNFVGTHYGGSFYSMNDPFYMLMLIGNLGDDYVVWDKAAHIRFRKPGKGKVRAEFRLTHVQLDDIRQPLKTLPKYEPTFLIEVKDESGDIVAEVQKVLHIRKKVTAPSAAQGKRHAPKEHGISRVVIRTTVLSAQWCSKRFRL